MNFTFIAKLLFPPMCVSCGKEGSFLCKSCFKEIIYKENMYKKNPLGNNLIRVLYTPCDYHSNKSLQKALHGLKYKYYKDVAIPLAKILKKSFNQNPPAKNTCIVPIPLHKKREAFRGFNQAKLLANHLSNLTGYRVFELLKREIDTVSQATLNRKNRLKNMENAFSINIKDVLPKTTPIMLVDDVCTTLSTFKAAAQTLQNAGYKIILCTALTQA